MATGTRTSKRRSRLPAAVLRDIVNRVAKAARPEKIILFGSAARGTMGPNSDVDLLVIKRGRFNRARQEEAIYRSLRGADAPVDVILVTPEEVERYRDAFCLVIYPALREGKVVYGA
jgi:predicted nucleotidyltransferase